MMQPKKVSNAVLSMTHTHRVDGVWLFIRIQRRRRRRRCHFQHFVRRFFFSLLRNSCEKSNCSHHVITIYINVMRLLDTRAVASDCKLNESRKNALVFFVILTIICNGHVEPPKNHWKRMKGKTTKEMHISAVSKCTSILRAKKTISSVSYECKSIEFIMGSWTEKRFSREMVIFSSLCFYLCFFLNVCNFAVFIYRPIKYNNDIQWCIMLIQAHTCMASISSLIVY